LIAEHIDDASVLFVDLVGFTPFSAGRPAGEVVGFLNEVFSQFDRLVEEHGLEKIKTNGDAYMVAGNVLGQEPDHLQRMARLALALMATGDRSHLNLRVGLHSGPVVAGVIGTKKYLFDLWGETVNLASRLESHGEPGRIQVSEAVAKRLQGFDVQPRGSVSVKGVGDVETWWLTRRVTEVAD
jgi:adenylate cyclase/guanylate cyclase